MFFNKMSLGGRREREEAGDNGREMPQTMYAHMNKLKKKKKNSDQKKKKKTQD
jgi:hypothetical protein